MINLKKTLTENRDATAKKGCLMAMLSKEDTNKILKFSKQLINDEDLYIENNEYGRETEPHVTIRYGFLKDLNELEIRRLIKGVKSFMIELVGLDKFDTHPKYAVSMFKVNSPVLKRLNEMSGIYLNENEYTDYNPHLTLAYLLKNRFPHKRDNLNIKIPIKTICYSPISGGKSYFNLNESNTLYDIDYQIAQIDHKIDQLRNEWDQLDHSGLDRDRQMQIEKELQQLIAQREKLLLVNPKLVDPKDPRVPVLFNKIKNAIDNPPDDLLKEGQKFELMGYNFDIETAEEIIKRKNLKPKIANIVNYAEKMLSLDRNRPHHQPQSFITSIDYDFLETIPEDRLKVAGIIATIRTKDKKVWSIVIDGNHRLVKNYMSGKDTMPMYILDEKTSKEAMLKW